MKQVAGIIILFAFLFGPPTNLEKANQAYEEKKYMEAVPSFEAAMEEYPDEASAIRYNMAQCYMSADSSQKAYDFFFKSIHKEDKELSSMANNNLGVYQAAARNQPPPQGAKGGKQAQGPDPVKVALESFKQAMRLHPQNEEARYNYELLMKKQQQQEQNQDQENQEEEKQEDQQDQEQNQDQNQDQQEDQHQENKQDENSDQEEESQQQDQSSSKQNNKRPNAQEGQGDEVEYKPISMEQAQMLLEGMKENEKKFLQELKKAPTKKRPEDGKPNW